MPGTPQAGAFCVPNLGLGRWVQLPVLSGASWHLSAEAATPQLHLPLPPALQRIPAVPYPVPHPAPHFLHPTLTCSPQLPTAHPITVLSGV